MPSSRTIMGPLLFFLMIFLSIRPVNEPDFGWHVVTGQQILETASVPTKDIFTYSLPGHPFVAHSWLSEVLLAVAYQAAGLWGVSILYAAVVSLAFYWLWRSLSVKSKTPRIAMAVVLLIPISLEFLSLRTHLVSFAGLCYLYFLFSRLDILSKTGSFKQWLRSSGFWSVPVAFGFWANMHAGFTVGLAVLALLILAREIENMWENKQVRLSQDTIYLAIIWGVSVLATLINPYGLKVYALTFTMITNTSAARYNTDWLPLLSPRLNPDYLLLRMSVLIAAVITLIFSKTELKLRLLLGLFTLLTLQSLRYALPLFVFLLPEVVSLVNQVYSNLDKSFNKKLVLGCLACLTLLIVWKQWGRIQDTICAYQNPECYAQEKQYPLAAINYIRDNSLGLRIFNHYTWGGYLIWQFPEATVFIDGRMDNFFKGDKAFIQEFADIVELKPGWEERLDSYNSQVILIPPGWAFGEAIVENNSWQKVFADDTAEVFVPTEASDSAVPQANRS